MNVKHGSVTWPYGVVALSLALSVGLGACSSAASWCLLLACFPIIVMFVVPGGQQEAARFWRWLTIPSKPSEGASMSNVLLMVALACLLITIVWGFTRPGAPDPTGLIYGISAVAIGQVFVLAYYCIRRVYFPGALIQSKDHIKGDILGDVLSHLTQPEGFLLLACYLSGTWLLRLMPESYYCVDCPMSWCHVLLQLLIADFAMFCMHLLEHRVIPLYQAGHKPHHRWRSPKLTDAFNGSFTDTLFMILVSLQVSAQLLHVSCWSYIGFGMSYSLSLCLIHCEWSHAWDPLFAFVGIGTPADHHVHHRMVMYNFGHLFTYWDRLFGSYKSPRVAFKDTCA